MAKRRIPLKGRGVKPRFTVKDFLSGISSFESRMASEFVSYVKTKLSKEEYSFDVIEKLYGNGDSVVTDKMIRAIHHKDSLVFFEKGVALGEVTYAELFQMLEHGRKDLGILPQPIFRKAFEDFRPIYKQSLKNFLIGKK